ncbi:MAG: hypothetical protein AAF402_03310, partial [Pseudomonadota bacterium]
MNEKKKEHKPSSTPGKIGFYLEVGEKVDNREVKPRRIYLRDVNNRLPPTQSKGLGWVYDKDQKGEIKRDSSKKEESRNADKIAIDFDPISVHSNSVQNNTVETNRKYLLFLTAAIFLFGFTEKIDTPWLKIEDSSLDEFFFPVFCVLALVSFGLYKIVSKENERSHNQWKYEHEKEYAMFQQDSIHQNEAIHVELQKLQRNKIEEEIQLTVSDKR